MLPLRFHLPGHRGFRSLSLFTLFGSRRTLAFSLDSKVRSVAMASYSTATETSQRLLFRQLFEKESSTYTYLLADMGHHEKPAVLIDPVDKTADRDVSLIMELGVKLVYAMSTLGGNCAEARLNFKRCLEQEEGCEPPSGIQ